MSRFPTAYPPGVVPDAGSSKPKISLNPIAVVAPVAPTVAVAAVVPVIVVVRLPQLTHVAAAVSTDPDDQRLPGQEDTGRCAGED